MNNATYYVLFLMNSLYFMVVSTFVPFLPAYYRSLGFSMLQVGVLASVGSLSAILIQPLWSNLSDRIGNRRVVLRILLVGSLFMILLFILPRTFWGLLVVVTLFQSFFTAVMPVQDAISLTFCNQHGKSYAFVRSGGTIGFTLLVVFTGRLAGETIAGMSRLFIMGAGGFLLMLALTRFMPQDGDGAASRRLASIGTLLQNRRLMLFLLFVFAYQMGHVFLLGFGPIHIRNLGMSNSHIGYAMAIAAISELPVLMFIDKVLKRHSPARIMLFSSFVLAVRLMMTAAATDFTGIALSYSLHGLCFMTAFYCGIQFINREVPAELKASGVGLLSLIQVGFASIVSAVGGGWLSDRLTIPVVFRLDSVLILALAASGTLIYLFRSRIPFLSVAHSTSHIATHSVGHEP